MTLSPVSFRQGIIRLRLRHLAWPEGPNACSRGARWATFTAFGATGTIPRHTGALPVALRVPSGGRIRCAPSLTTSRASLGRGGRCLAVGPHCSVALLDWREHRAASLARAPATQPGGLHDQPPCGRMPQRPPGPDHPPPCGPSGNRCPYTLIRHPHPFAGCAGPVGPVWLTAWRHQILKT